MGSIGTIDEDGGFMPDDSVMEEQSEWWYVKATFQTTDGEPGGWSGDVEVKPGEDFAEVARCAVVKNNVVERALDLELRPYPAGHTPGAKKETLVMTNDEAFIIVLDLAKQNVISEIDSPEEYTKQTTAIQQIESTHYCKWLRSEKELKAYIVDGRPQKKD